MAAFTAAGFTAVERLCTGPRDETTCANFARAGAVDLDADAFLESDFLAGAADFGRALARLAGRLGAALRTSFGAGFERAVRTAGFLAAARRVTGFFNTALFTAAFLATTFLTAAFLAGRAD